MSAINSESARPQLRLIQGGLSQETLPNGWRSLGDRIVDCTAMIGMQLASGRWARVASLIEYRRDLLAQLRMLSSDEQSRRCVAALEAAMSESEAMVARAAALRVGAGSDRPRP
ncbi:MAG: hypothetical protein KDI32_12615 [Pseudomonadales bacterium]|nr:hypothetical protein [Pseudomonadales bacterium]